MSAAVARPAFDADPAVAVDIAALLGPDAWSRLAPAVRRRFAAGHMAAPITYAGRMQLRRSRAGWLIALLAGALGSPLPVAQADDCPTDVAVSSDGRGGIVWARSIHLPGGAVQRVVSTKRIGSGQAAGRLLECVRGGLGMVLDVSERDGALVFESRRYFLAVGPLTLPLPHVLTPGRCIVTHADAGPSRFRFTLSMHHPLFGETFRQDGLFRDPEER